MNISSIKAILPVLLICLMFFSCNNSKENQSGVFSNLAGIFRDSVWVEYKDISGIGYEEGVSRRDPSDIIEADGKLYVWHTKIPMVTAGERTRLYNSGYYGTIWYAVSEDGGYSWTEKGKALGPGPEGEFDSHAVFTPNILFAKGKYYLFYTAVKPTPGNQGGIFENNSTNDYTGLFSPHLTKQKQKSIPGWGLSMGNHSGHIYLKRFEFQSK